jgi:hypothetical protein
MSKDLAITRFKAGNIVWRVNLARGVLRERLALEQLRRLLLNHDLKRYSFTRRIRIEHGAVPHSHPILTLNTRYLQDDNLALSVLVHEEIHWFLSAHNDKVADTVDDLMRLFPRVPTRPLWERTEKFPLICM